MRNKLIKIRKESGLKVSEIAEKLSISPSFYYKIEEGIRNPGINLAKKMGDLFNRQVEELFFADNMD